MDLLLMGVDVLETAMNAGSSVVSSLDSVVQVMGDGDQITCEVSRCEWA